MGKNEQVDLRSTLFVFFAIRCACHFLCARARPRSSQGLDRMWAPPRVSARSHPLPRNATRVMCVVAADQAQPSPPLLLFFPKHGNATGDAAADAPTPL